jgi:hypothetical protein
MVSRGFEMIARPLQCIKLANALGATFRRRARATALLAAVLAEPAGVDHPQNAQQRGD